MTSDSSKANVKMDDQKLCLPNTVFMNQESKIAYTLADLALYLGDDFKASEWTESKDYFIHNAAQGTPQWEKIRRKVLMSGSKAAVAINKYIFLTQDEYCQELETGVMSKTPTPEQLQRMKLGNTLEPVLRQWLATKLKLKISEVGFIIPKFDIETGYSADGLINSDQKDGIQEEGIIEIKTIKKMPWRLNQYRQLITDGWIPPQLYHDHIYDSHYCQMQKGMADTNREYCIYLVYDVGSGEIYVEKIMRNCQYWTQVLYPGIRQLIEKYKMKKCEKY